MSVFTGMPRTVLQANLAELQAAYISLAAGSKVESANYTQGDGSKSVTFSRANLGQLTALIAQLQKELGIIKHARRPIYPVYR